MNADDTRNQALEILREVLLSGRFIQDAVKDAALSEKGASDLDSRFIRSLVRGTTEWKSTLEVLLGKLSSVPVRKIKPVLRLILFMGLYELLYANQKDYAAVNEYVRLARRRGFQGLSGFVNAVLRRASSEKAALLQSLTEEESSALPEEVLSILKDSYGRENALLFGHYVLTADAKRITVRRNISRCTEEEFLNALRADGAEAERLLFGPDSAYTASFSELPPDEIYFLTTEKPIASLKAFLSGLFYVQDVSAWSAFRGLGAHMSSETAVLDLCAAPGGKCFQLMDLAGKAGFKTRFTACDLSDKRLRRLRENAERMGFTDLKSHASDATVFEPSFEQAFGLVIADVPCSGLGDLAGKPEIRFHVNEASIRELQDIQKRILQNAARYVKPGGLLQYSTCTLNREENEDQVRAFLSEHPEYSLIEETTLISGVNTPGDGFYHARMKRLPERI